MKKTIENKLANIVTIKAELENKGTLKAAKEAASKAKVGNINATTKKAFIESLDTEHASLSEHLENLNNPVQVLKRIADSINSKLDMVQATHLEIGQELTEARALFDDMKSFLVWSKASTGLQKAQVYKLMAVYKNFGDSSVFSKVSMRVLYTLCSASKEVVEAAQDRIEAGKVLNTKALNRIIDTIEGAKPVEPVASSNVNDDSNGKLAETKAIKDGKKVLSLDDTEPEEEEEASQEEEQEAAKQASLKEQIEALQAELANSKKAMEKLIREKKAMILPQFKNACMYARLGLSLEQSKDKQAVQSSYRALAAIYNAANYPEIAASLKEAREALL